MSTRLLSWMCLQSGNAVAMGVNVIAEMCQLLEARGAKDLNQLDGLYECKVDDRWTVWVNAHAHEVNGQPPYTFAVDFNGLPAGLFAVAPGIGTFVSSEAANVESFRMALKAARGKS